MSYSRSTTWCNYQNHRRSFTKFCRGVHVVLFSLPATRKLYGVCIRSVPYASSCMLGLSPICSGTHLLRAWSVINLSTLQSDWILRNPLRRLDGLVDWLSSGRHNGCFDAWRDCESLDVLDVEGFGVWVCHSRRVDRERRFATAANRSCRHRQSDCMTQKGQPLVPCRLSILKIRMKKLVHVLVWRQFWLRSCMSEYAYLQVPVDNLVVL